MTLELTASTGMSGSFSMLNSYYYYYYYYFYYCLGEEGEIDKDSDWKEEFSDFSFFWGDD